LFDIEDGFAAGQERKGRLGTKQILTLRLNYENYGSYHFSPQPHIDMKQPLLLAVLLAVSTYFYLHNSASPTSAVGKTTSAPPSGNTVAVPTVTIVAAPSSYNRWKTGPNAQTDLKTGPNAQTDFEPFAPNEQATWNQTPGYTIVSGLRMR
jgi:hypothetical protein